MPATSIRNTFLRNKYIKTSFRDNDGSSGSSVDEHGTPFRSLFRTPPQTFLDYDGEKGRGRQKK